MATWLPYEGMCVHTLLKQMCYDQWRGPGWAGAYPNLQKTDRYTLIEQSLL